MNTAKTLLSLGVMLLPFAIIFYCVLRQHRLLKRQKRRNAANLTAMHELTARAAAGHELRRTASLRPPGLPPVSASIEPLSRRPVTRHHFTN